jgi:hypothetical protein
MRATALLTAAAFIAAASPAEARIAVSVSESLAAVMAADARLQTIGWRLARGNADFCLDTAPAIGLLLLDARNFRDPQTIRAALALSGDIAVDAVAEGSPADRSGLRAGEEVLSIADLPMADLKPVPAGNYGRLASLHDRIDAALAAEGKVTLMLRNSGSVSIAGQAVCRSRFVLSGDGSSAGSDGQRVRVREDLLTETTDDEEAAAAIAHELAHNILRHPQRLDLTGRSSDTLRATEAEADRLAPWLMANAGYDPEAAVRFAERRQRAAPLIIFQAPTHERWDKRLVAIREEVTLIAEERIGAESGPLDWRKRFAQGLAAARKAEAPQH